MTEAAGERIVRRRARIRDLYLSDPALSWGAGLKIIADEFPGEPQILGRGTIADIANRECLKAVPGWRKLSPLVTHGCNERLKNGRVCGRGFIGERGYSGKDAVKCKRHRKGWTA